MDVPVYSAVVVGAGVAGLLAARELSKDLSDVLVLEASDRIGGRVQEVCGLVSWPVQEGPEFIHGGKNILARITEEEMKCRMREMEWPDHIYIGREKRMLTADDQDKDIAHVDKLFTESVGEEKEPPPGKDINGEDWLRSKPGVNSKMVAFAEACYANDFGASLKQLGLREMITENRSWDSGDTYLVPDRSWKEMITYLAADLAVQTSWPVASVRYSPGGVLLTSAQGAMIAAKRVILTPSLKVLQAGKIRFEPALPDWKLAAIHRLKMSNAIKARDHSQELRGLSCVVCFIAGEKAERLSASMAPEEMVAKSVEQLDALFATEGCQAPASRALHTSHVSDWAKEEYVMGAYSFPSHGAEAGDRQALAAPLDGTVFFAGEATHPAINPCMQAAMETGLRAAAEVMAAERSPPSRL
eukprot:jgi/Tetstr1/437312/TSEL_002796.t1